MRDPNSSVSGDGIAQLKTAGIEVVEDVLTTSAEKFNQAYIKNQKLKLPYITLKLALTFDGKLALDSGQSRWITSEESRQDVQQLRARSQAIGVGRKTIEVDNPSLNIRTDEGQKSFQHLVLFGKPQSKTKPPSWKFLEGNPGAEIHLLVRKKTAVPNYVKDELILSTNLKSAFKRLYGRGVCQVFIEGGPQLASELLKEGLGDELYLYYGLGFIGSSRHSIGGDWRLKSLEKSTKFRPEDVQLLGSDVRIRGRFHVYRSHSKSG
jgi:diaminohydroxyphosphoribosylaminopyrimidine deaminase / 5-amino-6-(5-phosphoribosylamino)uracil reductase